MVESTVYNEMSTYGNQTVIVPSKVPSSRLIEHTMEVQGRQTPIPSSVGSQEKSTQVMINTCEDLKTTTCGTTVPPNKTLKCVVESTIYNEMSTYGNQTVLSK